MRRIDEILNRLTEIRNMMAAPDYDEAQSEALLDEVRKLNQEKAEIEARAAQTAELRRQVGAGTVAQIQRQEQEARGAAGAAADENPADSPVYRRAWLKNMAVRDGVHLFGELTQEERAAFTVTTANTGAVVPTQTMNRIIELVESMSPMYDDANKTNMTMGFGVPRHKAIVQGDAKGVAEAAVGSLHEGNAVAGGVQEILPVGLGNHGEGGAVGLGVAADALDGHGGRSPHAERQRKE